QGGCRAHFSPQNQQLAFEDCHKDKERTHIGRALAANGYPRQFIHKFSQDRKIAEKKSDTEERKGFATPKDPLPKEKKTGVIYSIPCGECETFYIGETGRSLATRQKEHQSYVRLNKTE
ncbi:hypothetical protein QZH41_010393, partial [Actinostola sp. cb2023]